MDFSTAIESKMQDVNDGSTEPFLIYRDKNGGWHCDYTHNQFGMEFAWVEKAKSQDPFAVIYTGKDFSKASFPSVYDTVLYDRISTEYYVGRGAGRDSDSLNALKNFFCDNVSSFSHKATDYRTEEKDGDYTTVAHISTERDVTFYDKDMPEDVRGRIEAVAQSPDTWAFGFKPLPGMAEQNADKDMTVNNKPDSHPSEPELMMPDPSIGYSEMNLYGYSADDMYPLTAARAVELFDTNHTIYLLYRDNTEAMAFDRDEIITFSSDGLCGITHADWELSPVRAAREAEAKTIEASREAELLYGSGNRFGIYQIRDDMEENRNYRFASLEELQALSLDVECARYELVYTAPFNDRIEFLTDRQPVLNRLFEELNLNHPADYKGSSVSVSDVIVLKYNGSDVSSHYVDRMGFVEIDQFVGNEKAQLPMQPEAAVYAVTKEMPAVYSQVGNNAEEKRPDAPKGRPTLAERLAENKLKAARQGQPDAQKVKLQGVRE